MDSGRVKKRAEPNPQRVIGYECVSKPIIPLVYCVHLSVYASRTTKHTHTAHLHKQKKSKKGISHSLIPYPVVPIGIPDGRVVLRFLTVNHSGGYVFPFKIHVSCFHFPLSLFIPSLLSLFFSLSSLLNLTAFSNLA